MNKLTDKQRQEVFQQDAVIKLSTVYNVIRCLDTASTRGAFKANEMTFVGNIHDMLATGLNKAFETNVK